MGLTPPRFPIFDDEDGEPEGNWPPPGFGLVRPTDPDTSHQAAAEVSMRVRASQEEVLEVFRRRGPRLTFEQLIAAAKDTGVVQSDSGLRTRTAELVDGGMVRDSGDRAKTKAGRNCVVWEITDEGRRHA